MPIELVEGLGDQLEQQSSLADVQVCGELPATTTVAQRFGVATLPTNFSQRLTEEDIQACWQQARVQSANLKKSGKRVTSHDMQRIALDLIKQKGDELDNQASTGKKPVKRKILRKKVTKHVPPETTRVSVAEASVSTVKPPPPQSMFSRALIEEEVFGRRSAPESVKMRLTWQGRVATSRCLRVIDDPNFVVFVYSGDSDRPLLFLKTPSAYETCRLHIRYDGMQVTRRVLSGACRFQDAGHKYVMFIVVPDSL